MLKNRLAIAEMFRDLGFTKGAEIGVFDGYYSEVLCQTIPGLKLYSVDAWEVYPGYRDHKFESSMRRAESKARERLAKYDCHIIKKFSTDALADFKDDSLDFVYIDANHEYRHVKQDIECWSKKVRIGGIVAGDDYYMTRAGNFGVIQAIHEYVEEHNYTLNITPWDLDDPAEDNRQPQWYFWRTW